MLEGRSVGKSVSIVPFFFAFGCGAGALAGGLESIATKRVVKMMDPSIAINKTNAANKNGRYQRL
jgi:hypothetical protein